MKSLTARAAATAARPVSLDSVQAALAGGAVALTALTEPYVSDRRQFPALHRVADGLSPWELGVSPAAQATVAALSWSIISFDRTTPVASADVIATETTMVVEVVAIGHDGSTTTMGTRECVLRTELDDRSLADRKASGQGWLLPLGYTVVIGAPIV